MVAALLGLSEGAKQIVVSNRLKNPRNRFDAMWGPIYDAVPDIDGTNSLNTLQLMAFQSDGDRILIIAAWPKTWNVPFRLHAARGTAVDCVYRDGKGQSLRVTPARRSTDVQVIAR